MKKQPATDILAEFDDLLRASGDDGITTTELAKAKGCSEITARRAIKIKMECGAMIFAGKKRVLDMAGSTRLVPFYKLVKAKKSRS